MGFLEAMRSLARSVDCDDPDVVAEFAWILASAPPAPSELASSLWALLARAPAAVEVWVAANHVLGAIDLEEAAVELGEELLAHLGACPLHGGRPAPLAIAKGAAIGMVPTGPVRACRFRVLPVGLLERVGMIRAVPVVPRCGGALLVDGRRVDEARYPWPALAGSLASLAVGAP